MLWKMKYLESIYDMYLVQITGLHESTVFETFYVSNTFTVRFEFFESSNFNETTWHINPFCKNTLVLECFEPHRFVSKHIYS